MFKKQSYTISIQLVFLINKSIDILPNLFLNENELLIFYNT